MNRKIASGLLTGAVALIVAASPVLAANPHFVYADFESYAGPIQDLNVDFHVAGLGNSTGATTATMTGEYQVNVTCINKGRQNKPPVGLQGLKTRTVNSQDVYPDATGQYWGTLALHSNPPLCPRGMDYDLSTYDVTWIDVTMTLSNSGGPLDTYPIYYEAP